MRRAVPTDMRVTHTLWFLATGADYRTVGHFVWYLKIDCLVTKDVCSAIIETTTSVYQVSNRSCLERDSGFRNDLGFPQCAGAVDGSHIPIISPQECPADYCNVESRDYTPPPRA